MERVYHATQSMTGTLKGQPQTSMISHLVNVFFGYTQLKGRRRATKGPLRPCTLLKGSAVTHEERKEVCSEITPSLVAAAAEHYGCNMNAHLE